MPYPLKILASGREEVAVLGFLLMMEFTSDRVEDEIMLLASPASFPMISKLKTVSSSKLLGILASKFDGMSER